MLCYGPLPLVLELWGPECMVPPTPSWGVMREPAEICPWSIAQPYSLGGGSNAAASLLQQLAYCYATIRDASLTCARKPTRVEA